MSTSLDDLLSLEDQFFQEGHTLGLADGERAGRAEGRQFGMLKGFEKFGQLGRLHGRAEVLQAELSKSRNASKQEERSGKIASLERTRKHIERLLELTDMANMQPVNTEEAVADVDERLKDSSSKAILIAKITGEELLAINSTGSTNSDDQLEDFRAKTRFDTHAT